MGRFVIVSAIIVVMIVACGAVSSWNEIGSLRGSIVCPRPGEEFPGKKDVIEVPISVTSNGTWATVRIERGGRTVWSEPIEPSGSMIAKVIDPDTLRELNQKGFVDLRLVLSAQKQAEQMPIAMTGLSKESGSVPKESPPVLFRAIREGSIQVDAVPLGGSTRIKVSSKSRKIAVYSRPKEQLFGLMFTYDKVETFPNPRGTIYYTARWGIGDESVAISDGSGTTAVVLLKPVVAMNDVRNRQPPPRTDEVSAVSFEAEGIIGYPFNGEELLWTIVTWVAISAVLALLAAGWRALRGS